ncbi:GNAT family N-acetyltransferase [Brachybacterium sp. AOP43-C2-M15]|uniref:GNAT family N-acetyltransferase n=1 Tax=Brachybacterium sp. AOP43-C2-M15 TaxID=3457661 RepID=UPI004033966E
MTAHGAVRIAPAAMTDVPQVRTVIARSLSDDPMLRWLFPEDCAERLSRIALFFSGQVEQLIRHGAAHHARVDGEIVGAALWIPEGMERASTLPAARDLPPILLGGSRYAAFGHQFAEAREGAPAAEGAYLATLGVLAEHRERGIGRALVRAGHELLGEPTWLETTDPHNVDFYQHLGYETVHRAPFADGTTSMIRLVRDPARHRRGDDAAAAQDR